MAIDEETARYWGRAYGWRLQDAWMLIACEKDPRETDVLSGDEAKALRGFKREIEHYKGELWLELLFDERMPPAEWIELCDQLDIPVPANLRAAVANAWQSANQKGNRMTYSTPHLAIMQAAIAEFFEPRRKVDPKKDEVVNWIKRKMTEAGLPDSDNIAQAMFTIIKPVDHDPRKRRG